MAETIKQILNRKNMAKRGHKGKKPMVKERTRKLSKTEIILLEEEDAILTSLNHVVVFPGEISPRLEKHRKQILENQKETLKKRNEKLAIRKMKAKKNQEKRKKERIEKQQAYEECKNVA